MATFLELFFHKSDPNNITFEDIESFRKLEQEENLNLEYKSGDLLVGKDRSYINSKNKLNNEADKGFSDLAKSIIGFANAEGGLLILGIEEIPDIINGRRIKRSGSIQPVPAGIITKEMLESRLRALIQLPLDDLRIIPLKVPHNQSFVYLIDVPQSVRAPHQHSREKIYYQRRNFSTEKMEHYQISDLFGKRLAPSLEITCNATIKPANKAIFLKGTIHNFGRIMAKYPMCLINILSEQYKFAITGSPYGWNQVEEKKAQYTPGSGDVIYPNIGLNLNQLQIAPLLPEAYGAPLSLSCMFCAEKTQPKLYTFSLTPPVGENLPDDIQMTFTLLEQQSFSS